MHFYSSFLALVVASLLACTDSVKAHSVSQRPVKRVANPSTLALEILPRRERSSPTPLPFSHRSPFLPRSTTLRYDDSFRLTITAFDETFHLHLRPNDHLIHPAARVTYYATAPDGTPYTTRTRPLLRESVKVYWGEVIHADHSMSRMREDFAGVVPAPHPAELGWARIMVHHQGDIDQRIAPVFEGAFTAKGVTYHITTKDNYLRHKRPLDVDVEKPLDMVDSELVVWRDSDVMTADEHHVAQTGERVAAPPAAQNCGHDRLSFNTDPAQNPLLRSSTVSPWFDNPINLLGNSSAKRDDAVGNTLGTNFVDNIGQTTGCPNTQKVLYMGVAADCEYTAKYGDHANATSKILNDWNSASALYKSTFNVSLGIVELQIQDEICPNPVNTSFPWNVDCNITLNERLSLFSQWRGAKGPDNAGLWHLMSGCPTGTEVGIAWLGTLCQQSSSGTAPSVVSGTAVSTAGLTEWQVIAHEIGHNFGAIHDCADGCNSTSSCCPLTASSCDANAKFLMSPVAEQGETIFSPCSLGNICSLMTASGASRTNTTCLSDPNSNIETISLQMCGNGIVEAGEDCDPGEGVASPCCNSDTCKFTANAVCDPESSPCCTQQCGFAPSTQVCRPAKDAQCDMAETCTGTSSACPADLVKPNGQSCGSNGLACASGQCTSVALQCQQLGSSMNLTRACPSQSSDSCQVSCQDPTQANQCILLSAMLVDGSPCGYGGVCASAKCQSSGLISTAKAWFTQNLQIAIPVAIVAGLIALVILYWFGSCASSLLFPMSIPSQRVYLALLRCCRGRPDYPVTPAPVHQRLGSQDQMRYAPGAPPPGAGYPGSDPQAAWVDPNRYNGR
ncbi:zinc metalloprotease [Roridomyces roridus]|uniref:Disintegrin and metalloproteinase domain-containing protein B n=1 Tax=Roridomyces roridus TaxID=1738132 RepID=A0AAD7BTJ2_9AGAR|nr:zinc metalloprotease [Roridomyces roridus]